MANNQYTTKVTADASGYTAELDRARKSADAFAASQASAAQRVATAQQAIAEAATTGSKASASAINNFVSQLARTADQAGKTKAQLLEMKAAQLGIADSVSGYIGTIDKASESTHGFNLNTMSARRELLVLAHEASQGNWTKFGGSLGVLAERTDALSAILSAAGLGVGLFAGAIVFAGVEIYKTANAIDALQKSSVATNGYLGLTKDQITAMAESLSLANGGLVEVSATLTALIGSGQVSADTLSTLTGVVTQFGKDTGLTADKAAEAFVKMIEDPKKGIDELQTKYHTFSAAQIEVIDGYIKTGDTAQATKAFIDAVADSQHRMASQGTQEVGILTRIWQSFADAAKQAGDNFDRMGVAATNAQKLTDALQHQANAQKALALAKNSTFGNVMGAQADVDAANAQVAALQKVQAAQQKAADDNKARAKSGDAKVASDKYQNANKYASPQSKRDQDIAGENAAFKTATENLDKNSADYQKDLKQHLEAIAQINEQYAKKTRTHTSEGGINAAIAQVGADNAALESQRKAALAQAKADYDTGNKSYEQYYAQVHDTNTKIFSEELANAERRVTIAAGKKEQTALVAAQKEVQRITDERTKADQDYTSALATHAQQRAANVQKFTDQENTLLGKQQSGFDSANATQFMSAQEKANYAVRANLFASFEQQKATLKSQYESPTADQAEYALKLGVAQDYYDKAQSQLEANLALQQTVRESFNAQFKLALIDQAGQTQTNAELMRSGMTTTFNDMSTALETFVTTGKFSFSSLASSILSDLAKIALKAAETQIFNMVASSFSTGGAVGVGGGPRSFATGGSVFGAGSGTSDSIPAMLSNGEFVINAASTKKYSGLLEAINSGKLSHFATGGAVGSVASSSTSATNGNTPVSVTVNNNGGGGLDDKDAADLHSMVQAFVDKRLSQKMRGQGGYGYQLRHGQI
jgi:lambda family phage tail tape measure protein